MSQNAENDYGFRVKIPVHFKKKVEHFGPQSPLGLQFLPQMAEGQLSGSTDPLEEQAISTHGIIQKYQYRILLITSGACAIHCRYCFRRHYPYEQQSILKHLDTLDSKLKASPDIHEVILSGGDPLSLKNHQLLKILAVIKQHPQITTIRIHTRMPIVDPERVDAELLNIIAMHAHWQWVLVTHVNHADELDKDNAHTLDALHKHGVTLLNQAVLLKGVNDSVSALESLSITLFKHHVLPYYLHQLDPVQGAMHFHVPIAEGKHLIQALQAKLPGYLVPKYVCEEPMQPNKTPL